MYKVVKAIAIVIVAWGQPSGKIDLSIPAVYI